MADSTQIIYCEGEPELLPEYYNNGDITLFSGGLEIEFESPEPVSTIDQYNIVLESSNSQFGDLTEPIYAHSGCSNSIDSFFGFQTLDDTPGALNKIDKASFQIGGTATTFGDLIDPRLFTACVSNGVMGIWAGGVRFPTEVPTYSTQQLILTSGGTTNLWTDLLPSIMAMASGANDTYGFFIGGDTTGSDTYTTDQYRITFSNQSATRSWGDIDTAKAHMAGASDNIDVISAGGKTGEESYVGEIQRFNIANGWDSSEWSNLIVARAHFGGGGNVSKALFGGGVNPSEGGFQSGIESIEYMNGRTASSYDDLSGNRGFVASASGGGGLNNPIDYTDEEEEIIEGNLPDPCYKAIFAGGEFSGDYNLKMNIKSAATSQIYNGLIQYARYGSYGTSNGVIMLIGGNHYFSSANTVLDQLNFATEADSTVFGYLSVGRTSGSACSDGVSSFWISGDDGGENNYEKLDYDSGNVGVQFGTLDFIEIGASATDGTTVICGPDQFGSVNEFRRMQTFQTQVGGVATVWGDLVGGRYQTAALESDTYAIFWAGADWDGPGYVDRVDYFEFASQADASSWGTILDGGREYTDGCEDETTGVLGTGYAGQYYIQYDHILFASQSDATWFADLHTPWDRHHFYASASGGCHAASSGPIANCEDTTVFDLYSYIGFEGITFDSNMEDVKLYEAKDKDVDLYFKSMIITDRLDLSIDNLRTFHIDNCIFNTGSTIYFKHITDLEIKDLFINTDTIYHDEDFDVMNIEKSRVFILDSTINITEQDGNTLNFNSVNFTDTFVKELNVVSVID